MDTEHTPIEEILSRISRMAKAPPRPLPGEARLLADAAATLATMREKKREKVR